MNHSIKTGFSFGLTSGVITTLGLMIGLNTGTSSKMIVLGGILTIALADAFSDALGIHISEESENKHRTAEIWQSTVSTFLTKLITASSFALPIIFLPLDFGVMINIFWGILLLIILSYYIAKAQKNSAAKVITEHLLITAVVLVASYFLARWIKMVFI
ncbi:MAG: hypothetical protein M1338_01560 [Patescibacteria group bacterium]|nr:hypothetical protein [Patescibacteria group bacterium]